MLDARAYLVRYVSVRVKTEHLRDVLQWHVDDVLHVLFDGSEVWQRITLVKPEARLEECVVEPDVGEGAQQPLVEVVCDATAVLNLPDERGDICMLDARD